MEIRGTMWQRSRNAMGRFGAALVPALLAVFVRHGQSAMTGASIEAGLARLLEPHRTKLSCPRHQLALTGASRA
jgi:hypothetical protein